MNKSGERGSPYLKPFEAPKKPLGESFTNTKNLAELIHILIQLTHLISHPNPIKALIRKSQLTLSNAFSKSNFNIRPED